MDREHWIGLERRTETPKGRTGGATVIQPPPPVSTSAGGEEEQEGGGRRMAARARAVRWRCGLGLIWITMNQRPQVGRGWNGESRRGP